MSLSLLTASLPERRAMLAEALHSVGAQSVAPAVHLVGVDKDRVGPATVYNTLALQVDTEWMSFLDDDDLLDPDHVETLTANGDDADVVFTGCRSEGHNFTQYNGPFNGKLLERRCIVPITAAIRTKVFREIGGFAQEQHYDWGLWKRALWAGARFRQVPKITWTYRYHGANHSHGQIA